MTRLCRIAASALLVSTPLIGLPASDGANATASIAPSETCGTTRDTRQPVLLVHGFNSNAHAWDASKASLANSGTCVSTFDYGSNSTDWVTSPAIGKPLAAKIHQVALSSRAGGGTGKVIVVAHSMGGLATRCAVSGQCGEGSPFELRELITFGTPNHGTFIKSYGASNLADLLGPYLSFSGGCYGKDDAGVPGLCKEIQALGTSAAGKAFTPGSQELNQLPRLPAYIPDYAVAGSFPVTTNLFLHTFTVGDLGDLVVARESALSEGRVDVGLGGTAPVVSCGSFDLVNNAFVYHCWHGTETSYSGFIDKAKAEIAKTERADSDPVHQPTSPIKSLTIHGNGYPTSQSYDMALWAKSHITDCSAHSYGKKVMDYFHQDPCRGATRRLWTLNVNGRIVVLATTGLISGVIPGDINGSGSSGGLKRLELADSTGGMKDLLREGYRIPGVGGSIPAHEVFQVFVEDSGIAILDAWYASGSTSDDDSMLKKMESQLWQTEAAATD